MKANNLHIEIDTNSGFCFGVKNAINKAEEFLQSNNKLYCLGDIVHNGIEIERLENLGLITIDRERFKELKNCTVLLRAHGEPPETYEIAKKNNINLIDATCPIVINLQKKVNKSYLQANQENGQVVIYGKENHAEVIGLAGQTNDNAIVITDESDLEKINFSRPITLYSQTTKSITGYNTLIEKIKDKIKENGFNSNKQLVVYNTICGQVSNRDKELQVFAKKHDTILFVSGKKSSNGKMLFETCKKVNNNSFFISSPEEIDVKWLKDSKSIGICGATSTPFWLMEKTAKTVKNFKI